MTDSILVDMVRCAGHGICAHVLPERVTLDPWGFAIADPEPLAGAVLRKARRAARACPRRALLIERSAAAAPGEPVRARSS